MPIMSFTRITRVGCILAILIGSTLGQEAAIPTPFTYSHPIPPRRQWDANFGYCGETSFISAGLRFGQYCSQYTARTLATPGVSQSLEQSQILLGVNDAAVARKLRLQAAEFEYRTQRTTRMFTDWVKSHTLRGHVVIIGLFNNGLLLEEWTDRADGDPEYDHIVSVLGWGSKFSLDDNPDRAFYNDVVTINDNGLYGPTGDPPALQFLYSYRMFNFAGGRHRANNPNGPIYLLKNRAPNYGIAIEGPLDLDGALIPVSLSASNSDEPEMPEGSNIAPAPVPLTLTATVSIPDTTVAYTLYRYDDFTKVPVANFNASAAAAVQSWPIPAVSGSTFTVPIVTTTDATVIFRAVRQSAP